MQQEQIWIRTGCTLLDLVLGGGVGLGIPAGKVINVVGDSSSGKTFVCTEIIASAYHEFGKNLVWVYDDCESGFTFDSETLYGFSIMPKNVKDRFHSGTVQELYGNVRTFIDSIKKGQFGIYVCDTLDGLSSEELDELTNTRYKAFKEKKPIKKGSYRMESAKFLSQEFFRTLTDIIQDKQVLLIFVSQIRYNVDVLSHQKWSRAGGKALDFYAYACLWLTHVQDIVTHKRVVGSVVKAQTKKLKAPRPFRSCFFSLVFDYGLDNIASNVDFLYDLRTETGKLSAKEKLVWRNQDPEERTRSELIYHIEYNELEEALERRVIKKWEAEEDAVKSDRKRKYSKSRTKGKTTSDTHRNTKAPVSGDSANDAPSKTRKSTQAKKEDQA